MKNNEQIAYFELLEKLNLDSSETVLFSSDVSKLTLHCYKNKHVFEPLKFIGAFKKIVRNGNLLVPTFIQDFVSGSEFNKDENNSNMGTLSKIILNDKDFIRTIDPLHSFAFFGKDKTKFELKEFSSTFGSDSVFAFLYNSKAKMVLLDVDLQHAFTFAHFVEESVGVRYRKFKKIKYKHNNHQKQILFYGKRMGYETNLNLLLPLLLKQNVATNYELLNSKILVIDLEKAFEVIESDIMNNNSKNLVRFNRDLFFKSLLKKIILYDYLFKK